MTGAAELLDQSLILSGVNSQIRSKLNSLQVESSLDSTNAALRRLPLEEQHATVILAEHQSSGRGRRGRHWHSPYGRNLYLSLGWRFEQSMSELGCLPLVVALSAAKALDRAGLEGCRVKWPKDLLLDGRKLCGCLVEIQGDAQGPCHAVLGVGVNVHMPQTVTSSEIDQPWTDLHSQLPGCTRNGIAILLIEELVEHLVLFAVQGFEPFRNLWEQMDGLKGQTISTHGENGLLKGMAMGIDDQGALILNTGTEVLKLHSGEVSLNKTKI